MLPIKKLGLLEPVLLQSKITRSTATLYSVQSMLNFLENGRCSFIFTSLVVYTIPIISTKNTFLYFSQFSSPYSTLTCSQNHPYKPTNTPFLSAIQNKQLLKAKVNANSYQSCSNSQSATLFKKFQEHLRATASK